jgi:hypothetical protein
MSSWTCSPASQPTRRGKKDEKISALDKLFRAILMDKNDIIPEISLETMLKVGGVH